MLILVSRATLGYTERLNCSSIRLLDLKPGSGEEIVHFNLKIHSLDNLPDYIALSYTWGDPMDTVSILCDGKIVKVTRNLNNALWQLRENRKGLLRRKYSKLCRSQTLRFWVNAVCINQSDRKEKSFQVGLMAEVYQCACHVFAWLGPAVKNTDVVVDYLNEIGEIAEACGMAEGCEPLVSIWLDMISTPEHRRLDPPYIQLRRLDGTSFLVPRVVLKDLFDSIGGWAGQNDLLPLTGMKEFFTRPWWGRIWVLQEVTFAKNTDFICGSKMISKT
jgi:hypothetical protein